MGEDRPVFVRPLDPSKHGNNNKWPRHQQGQHNGRQNVSGFGSQLVHGISPIQLGTSIPKQPGVVTPGDSNSRL
jgi:hypothetical protein